MLDGLDKILEDGTTTLVGDDSGGQVSQDVGAHGLNHVAVVGVVEQDVDHAVSTLGVVEEHEERPVDEPRALLQHLQWRSDKLAYEWFTQCHVRPM